jgi:hypothetical protein
MINLFVSPSGMEGMCTACPPIAKTGKRQILEISHENSDGLISNRRIKSE